MPREDVILNFITKGSRAVTRQLGDIRTQSVRASRSVNNLDRALSALGGFLTIRALQQYADTFTLLQNRLRLVTEGTAELNAVTDELFSISQRTFTSFEQGGTLYARLARSVTNVSINQRELLEVTEAVNQAVALSSPTVQAANAGLVQFAQGIGSARFQGDELRSVLENLPRLAQAIAEGAGVSFQDIRELGRQGLLTPKKIIDSLRSQISVLDAEFKKFVPSIAFAITQLDNAFLRFVGRTDQAGQISRNVSRAITFLADNFDTLATAVLSAAAVLGAGALARALTGLTGLVVGLGVAIKGLTVIIIANPIGAALVAITAAVAGLVAFKDDIKVFGSEIITLGDAFTATSQLIKQELNGIPDVATSVFTEIGESGNNIITFMIDGFRFFSTSVIAILKGTGNTIIGFFQSTFGVLKRVFTASFEEIFNSVAVSAEKFWNENIARIETFANAVTSVFGDDLQIKLPRYDILDNESRLSAQAIAGDIERIFQEAYSTDFIGDFGDSVDASLTDIIARIKSRAAEIALIREQQVNLGANALERVLGEDAGSKAKKPKGKTTAEIIRNLKQELSSLENQQNMTSKAAGEYAKAQGLINKQLNNGRKVTIEQRAAIFDLVGQISDLDAQLQIEQGILDGTVGAQDDYALGLRAINRLMAEGLVTAETYRSTLADIRLEFLESQTTGIAGYERAVLKLGKSMGSAADQIESVMTNAFSNAEDAFVEFTKTGKISFSDLVDSVLADVTRLAFRQTISNALGGSTSDGIFGAIGGLLGALGGGGGGFATAGAAAGAGTSLLGTSTISSFARGGSFGVDAGSAIGNVGGTDNRLIAFRARDGEQVTVTPPGGSNGGDTVTYEFNITTPDADSFRRSQNQIMARAAAMSNRASARNN